MTAPIDKFSPLELLTAEGNKMQCLPLLRNSPVSSSSHSVQIFENSSISELDREEVPMDTSRERAPKTPSSGFSCSFDKPQLIQYRGWLFKVKVVVEMDVDAVPMLEAEAKAEVEQVLRAVLHCILAETDPPCLMQTENFYISPQLKFWPLSQQMIFVQGGQRLKPCKSIIELCIRECCPERSAPAGTINSSNKHDFADREETAKSKRNTKESHVDKYKRAFLVRNRKTEKRIFQEAGNKKMKTSVKNCGRSVVEKILCTEYTSENSTHETESEKIEGEENSPMETMAANFSRLTFLSPAVRRLRKRKAQTHSPTSNTEDCQGPSPKIQCQIPTASTEQATLSCCSMSAKKGSPDCFASHRSKHRKAQGSSSDSLLPPKKKMLPSRTVSENISDARSQIQDLQEERCCLNYVPVRDGESPGLTFSVKQKAGDSKGSEKMQHEERPCLVSQATRHNKRGLTLRQLLEWHSKRTLSTCSSSQDSNLHLSLSRDTPSSQRDSTMRRWLTDTDDYFAKSSGKPQTVLSAEKLSSSDCLPESLSSEELSQVDESDNEFDSPQRSPDGKPSTEFSEHSVRVRWSPTQGMQHAACIVHGNHQSQALVDFQPSSDDNDNQRTKHMLTPEENMPLKRMCKDTASRNQSMFDNSLHKCAADLQRNSEFFTSDNGRLSPVQKQTAPPERLNPFSEYICLSGNVTEVSAGTAGREVRPTSPNLICGPGEYPRPRDGLLTSRQWEAGCKVQVFKGKEAKNLKTREPFWAQATSKHPGQRGLEFVQKQIKLFVTKMSPKKQPQRKTKQSQSFLQEESLPEECLPSCNHMMLLAKLPRKKKLYAGSVLLAGDRPDDAWLGEILD